MMEEVVALAPAATSLRDVRFVLFGDEAESAFRTEADRQLTAK